MACNDHSVNKYESDMLVKVGPNIGFYTFLLLW